MSNFCYSQKTYPSKLIINKDTLIIIDTSNVIKINKTFAELDYYKEMSDTLQSQIKVANNLLTYSKSVLTSKNSEISLLNQLSIEKDKTIQLYKDNATIQRKQQIKNSVFISVLSIAVGIIIGKL